MLCQPLPASLRLRSKRKSSSLCHLHGTPGACSRPLGPTGRIGTSTGSNTARHCDSVVVVPYPGNQLRLPDHCTPYLVPWSIHTCFVACLAAKQLKNRGRCSLVLGISLTSFQLSLRRCSSLRCRKVLTLQSCSKDACIRCREANIPLNERPTTRVLRAVPKQCRRLRCCNKENGIVAQRPSGQAFRGEKGRVFE